jgi:hypothetical protein
MPEPATTASKPVLMPGIIDRTVLIPIEAFWRGHQKWLQDCGYMLRPRYVPGWQPSWIGKSGKLIPEYEDAQMLGVGAQRPFNLLQVAYI